MPLFDLLEGDIHTLLRPPHPAPHPQEGGQCLRCPGKAVHGCSRWAAVSGSSPESPYALDRGVCPCGGRGPRRGPVSSPVTTPLSGTPRRGVPIHRSPALPHPTRASGAPPPPLGAGAVRGDIQWAAVPGSALTSVSRRRQGRASLDPALLRPVPEQWTVVDIAIRGRGPGRGRIPLPAGEYPYSSSALPTPPALRAPPPPPPGGRGSYGDSHHGPVPGDSATSGFPEG